jgi:hypothetical protein
VFLLLINIRKFDQDWGITALSGDYFDQQITVQVYSNVPPVTVIPQNFITKDASNLKI